MDGRGAGVPSPGKIKNFLFSTSSRPALGSTQPHIQWGSFLEDKAAGAWSWPLTYSQFRGQDNVDLYIHSPICLYGVVLDNDDLTKEDGTGMQHAKERYKCMWSFRRETWKKEIIWKISAQMRGQY
jgi:hypothetical protein